MVVRTCVTSNKDLWLYVLNIPDGSQRGISSHRN
jgi:hypothetical protein